MGVGIGTDEIIPGGRFKLNLTTIWPVTAQQVKDNAQVPHNDDDPLIDNDIIPAATAYIERLGGVALITQTRKIVYDGGFPTEIETRWPLQSVGYVKYLDTAYAQQTVDSSTYRYLTATRPPRIRAKNSTPWPPAINDSEAVEVVYDAGYGDTADLVPPEWKRPIIILAGYWWAHRESYDAQFVNQSFFEVLKSLVVMAGGLVRCA